MLKGKQEEEEEEGHFIFKLHTYPLTHIIRKLNAYSIKLS